ncbi:hypothetical protein WH47_07307 [Habropoda laboriosa]|uniref:Uncharacterized protein n=1 Tax=Habropoda laboriosa TaxID=597456 RepID=A0A0L7R5W8_9HYME|nr:hypothetical protein WH47_07307 [Habropoda laboriosa]
MSEDARLCLNPNLGGKDLLRAPQLYTAYTPLSIETTNRRTSQRMSEDARLCLNPNLAPEKTSSTAFPETDVERSPIFLRNAAQCILTLVIERESVDMHGYGRWLYTIGHFLEGRLSNPSNTNCLTEAIKEQAYTKTNDLEKPKSQAQPIDPSNTNCLTVAIKEPAYPKKNDLEKPKSQSQPIE